MPTSVTLIAIVAIVMGCLVAIIESKHKSQAKADRGQIKKLEDEIAATRAQCKSLEERVVVLEKIVTDSGFDVQQEISRLG